MVGLEKIPPAPAKSSKASRDGDPPNPTISSGGGRGYSQTDRTVSKRGAATPLFFWGGVPRGTIDGKTVLGGILATVCPADKKRIHGVPDAVPALLHKQGADGTFAVGAADRLAEQRADR